MPNMDKYLARRTKTIKFSFFLTVLLIAVALIPKAYAPKAIAINPLFIKEIHTPEPYKEPIVYENGIDKATFIIKKTWRTDYKIGLILARCESGFREQIVNSIKATGYFQINAPVHNVPVSDMQNGWANASFAYILFKEQGFTPWLSSKSCWKDKI